MQNNSSKVQTDSENSLSKIIFINILILVILILIILAAIEGYLKSTIPATTGGSIFEYTLDTKRYKLMKKDAHIFAWGKELRTNKLGFRDNQAKVPAKRTDEFRIVVLGDSFTVSAGVDFDSIYTTVLEKNLQQHYKNVEVMNLATAGYNIVQYEMVLNEVALKLDPDLIIVSLFPSNDFSMDTYDHNYQVASGQIKIQERPWYKKFYVYRAFLWRIVAKVDGLINPKEKKVADSENERKRGWDENLSALARIIETARDKDLPLIISLLPDTWSYKSQHKSINRIKAFLAKYNSEPVVLLYPFIESGVKEKDLRVNLLDSHPNVQYNALVAKYLAPYVIKKIPEKNHH